jgi:hypothetical protein
MSTAYDSITVRAAEALALFGHGRRLTACEIARRLRRPVAPHAILRALIDAGLLACEDGRFCLPEDTCGHTINFAAPAEDMPEEPF